MRVRPKGKEFGDRHFYFTLYRPGGLVVWHPPRKQDRLVGLVVKASASGGEDAEFDSRIGDFIVGSSHTSDLNITVKYLVSAPPSPPPPLKHKFLRKVGGGRLLGILPFVQSIIQLLKVQVNTKRLEFKQKSY